VISVDMFDAARIRRTAAKGGDKHTVFRIGEVHGVITGRIRELVGMFSRIDSAKAVTNLWGERWSKLAQNGMRNGVSAVTGLTTPQCDLNTEIRRYAIQLGAEAVRVAQALGYELEKIGGVMPGQFALAAEGNADAMAEVEQHLISRTKANPRADMQRPSMAQDIGKGRRTEIDFMNGYIVDKGRMMGIPTPAHEKLVDLVRKIERGDLDASPSHLGG
jgi:2-dehydropantoate 2-reductase